MNLRKVAETATTITLAWEPVPGAEGWLFYKDGVRVSRSFDPTRRTVKFSKPGVYRVQAVVFHPIDQDTYPDPPPATYVKVAARVAYKDGGSDARYCVQDGVPGLVRDGDGWKDESGATYDANGLCRNGLRSDGSKDDCPTSARAIDGRPYCSLPRQGDPTKNTGSWLI